MNGIDGELNNIYMAASLAASSAIPWLWPVTNSLDLSIKHSDDTATNDMSIELTSALQPRRASHWGGG
jgi:hypothetical protein